MTTLNRRASASIARVRLAHESDKSAMFKHGAAIFIDINSAKVFEAVSFGWSRRFNIPSSGEYHVVIDTTGLDPKKELVVLPIHVRAFGAGPINVDFYRGATFTGGDTIPGFNRCTKSSNTPDTICTFGPAVSDKGELTPIQWMVPSDGVPATALLGGEAKDDLIINADSDENYLLHMINTEANIARCQISFTIFEAIPGEV